MRSWTSKASSSSSGYGSFSSAPRRRSKTTVFSQARAARSGAANASQCHHSHTEARPCVWVGSWCTKGQLSGLEHGPTCPSPVPSVALNTGAQMPMIAFGTGMLPLNSVREQRRLKSLRRLRGVARRSAIPHLNTSLALGFTHIDTSEVYPDFDEVGAILKPHRHRLFVTSKVDPTIQRRKCATDGGGCSASMLMAAALYTSYKEKKRRHGFSKQTSLAKQGLSAIQRMITVKSGGGGGGGVGLQMLQPFAKCAPKP